MILSLNPVSEPLPSWPLVLATSLGVHFSFQECICRVIPVRKYLSERQVQDAVKAVEIGSEGAAHRLLTTGRSRTAGVASTGTVAQVDLGSRILTASDCHKDKFETHHFLNCTVSPVNTRMKKDTNDGDEPS